MARFAPWWTKPAMTTPAGISTAAQAAGVFVESGDYKLGSFDFGDGGPLADILVSGTVVAAGGGAWLVYPAPTPDEGWRAREVAYRSGDVEIIQDVSPRQLGSAYDQAARIVGALVPEQPAVNIHGGLPQAVVGINRVSLSGF